MNDGFRTGEERTNPSFTVTEAGKQTNEFQKLEAIDVLMDQVVAAWPDTTWDQNDLAEVIKAIVVKPKTNTELIAKLTSIFKIQAEALNTPAEERTDAQVEIVAAVDPDGDKVLTKQEAMDRVAKIFEELDLAEDAAFFKSKRTGTGSVQ